MNRSYQPQNQTILHKARHFDPTGRPASARGSSWGKCSHKILRWGPKSTPPSTLEWSKLSADRVMSCTFSKALSWCSLNCEMSKCQNLNFNWNCCRFFTPNISDDPVGHAQGRDGEAVGHQVQHERDQGQAVHGWILPDFFIKILRHFLVLISFLAIFWQTQLPPSNITKPFYHICSRVTLCHLSMWRASHSWMNERFWKTISNQWMVKKLTCLFLETKKKKR